MRKWVWLIRQEVVAETRGLERLPVLILFAVVLLITLRFALPPAPAERAQTSAGFLWASVVFSAMLELRRTFEPERRAGAMDALRLAPVDPSVLLAAKLASALGVLVLLEALLVPATAILFGGRASGVLPSIAVAAAGSVGLLSWGILFSAATAGTRSGDAVLAVLLFPLIVPATISAVRLIGHYLGGATIDDPMTGFLLIGAFDVLSLGTSILLFEYVLD